ncbi:MAG: hypothetical protein V2I36_10670, partial [Desulfopila sp.]|nr:hypothetical protein [Desulfopila sp.]
METNLSKISSLNPSNVATIEKNGSQISPLDPIGARIQGVDLTASHAPSPEVIGALEDEMANRGFLAFKNKGQLTVDDFLRVSCWWGGKELHSTHGVHPATPGG